MKRTLALILALVMVLPVSFISALAHGPGVGKNNITNQSIHNALNQPLPETVYVDGKYDDTAWDKDEWNSVTKRTGTWDSNAPTDVNFSYKYQIKMDSEYLYGVFSVGSGASEIKIWLNDDAEVKKATDTIVITDLNNSMPTITINGDAPDKDKGTDGKYNAQKYQIKSAVDTVENNGNRVIEFRVYRKNFAGTDKVTYFTAVKKGNNSLYYPVIATNGNETLATPDVKWPANAIVVTRRDILDPKSDKHLPVTGNVEEQHRIDIDGKLEEPMWVELSDFRESDNTSHQFVTNPWGPLDLTLKNGSTTGYSVNHGNPNAYHYHTNGGYYCAAFSDESYGKNDGIRFKYDLRTDGDYLYGAVMVYDRKGNTKHNIYPTDDIGGMTWAEWQAAYANTTYINVNFYNAGSTSAQPVVGQLQIKCDGTSNTGGSTYHIFQGGSAYSTQFTNAKEKYESDIRKAGAMRMSDEIVTFEFKIDLKYLGNGTSAPDSFNVAIEAFEGTAIDEDDNNGTARGEVNIPTSYYRYFDAYASTDYISVNKETHPTIGIASGISPNGGLVASEWNNLNATDYFVNGSFKNDTRSSGNILSFQEDVTVDHDYIYGAAVILLSSKIKQGDDPSDATAYRLWINDKGANTKFTEVISFYNDSKGKTRVMLSDGNTGTGEYQHTYYIKGDDGYYAAHSYDGTSFTFKGNKEYGLEAVMRTVSASELDADYQSRYPQMYAEVNAGKVVVIEYKIPLQLARTETPIYYEGGNDQNIFAYSATVEDGWNTGIGLCVASPANAWNKSNYRVFKPGEWDFSASKEVYASQALDTFFADGMRGEFYWNSYEDYIGVNGSTGYYNPPQESNNTYAFGQTAYVGQNNFYGFAILDDEAKIGVSEYTLWINADPAQNGYTHLFIFTPTEDGLICTAQKRDGTPLSLTNYDGVWASANTVNGRTNLEFMIDLDLFDPDRSGFEYTVSSIHEVNGETLTLYYPATDTYDKLFVTHINEATYLQHREGSIYTYEHTLKNPNWIDGETYRVPNGYAASYYIFTPTDVKNVYEVTYATKGRYHPVDPATNAQAVKEALKSNLEEGEFIYAIYDTSFDGTSNEKKTAFGKGYILDCDEQFTVGAKVTFKGLGDLKTTVDPDEAFEDSNFGYELEALEVYFSVQRTDADDRNANFPDNAWYKTALSVDTLSYFYPELIDVDGSINDSGWDPNGWTEVYEGINGSLQSVDYAKNNAQNYNYKYQMRTDGENVYFAFVLYDVHFAGTHGAGVVDSDGNYKYCPSVRVWIKSKNEEYKDAVSFTHLYDVRYGIPTAEAGNYDNGWDYVETTLDIDKFDIHGQNHAGQDWYLANAAGIPEKQTGVTTYSNGKITYVNTQLRFAKHFGNATGGYKYPWGGNPDRTEAWTAGNKFPATTANQPYSASDLFGETIEFMENTTTGAHGSDESWFAWTDTSGFEFGSEHGRWTYDDSNGNSIVEFKFNLKEIGCSNGEGFEYFVHGAFSGESYESPFTMFNPHVTTIPYGAKRSFNPYVLPFWNWDETTSLKYNASYEYSHMLRNNYRPAVTLGAKVSDPDENGKLSIRFGGRYTEEYIRRLLWNATNMGDEKYYEENGKYYDSGNKSDENQNPADRVLGGAQLDGITDYWDVSKVGIVFYFTQKLNVNSENQPELYIDTPNAVNVDSVGIYNWKQINGENPNFADYEDYVFYVTLENMAPAYKNVKYSFRSYVTYYEWEGSEAVYDQILERSWQQVKDNSENGINGFPQYDEDYKEPGNSNPGFQPGGSDEPEVKNYNGATIAYIPLDNRPVNIDRAIYLAQSTGFNILMPPEELYTTKIDSVDVPGDESAVGDPQALFQWIKDNENNADYFVISLDQLLSGGLVGSRDYAGINNLNESGAVYDPNLVFEETVVRYLADLVTRKDVVFFDSQMRLASTGEFNGYTTKDHYYFFRYGYAMHERPEVDVTQANALEQIFANYGKDKYGNNIVNSTNTDDDEVTLPDYRSDPNSPYYESWAANTKYKVDKSYIERYLKSRERKMKISEMLFDYGVVKNSKLFYVGIDDSNPLSTIHDNETRWLNYKGASLKNFKVFSGIDEIGLMSLSAFVTSCYGKVNAVVNYYGGGEKEFADAYGTETLEKTVNVHVTGVGANLISPTATKNYLNVLVLTKGATTADINGLIDTASDNIDDGIATAIIDASDKKGQLGEALVNSGLEITKLLGYSNWNTVANASGLSISPAVARFSYLKNSNVITDTSHVGALKQISYSFIKDVAYTYKFKSVGLSSDTEANRIARAKADDSFYTWQKKIVNKINGGDGQGTSVASVMTAVGEYGAVGQIKFIGELYWPWNRAFEASFDLAVRGTTNWALNTNNGVVTLPETTGTVSYGAILNDGNNASSFDWNDARFTDWWSTSPYKKVYDEAGAPITQVTIDFTDGNGNAATHGVGFLTANILKREDSSGISLPDAIKVYALDENGKYVYVGEFKYNTDLTEKNEWITAGIEFVETTSIRLDIYGTGHIMMNEIQVW